MTPTKIPCPRWMLWGAIVFAAAVALLPWRRNHGFVRDFYDYGLVMAANARIDAGERPYRDFATPIQAGFFALNYAAEKLLGGNFQALTRGAALGTVLAAAGLAWLLTRRLGPVLAALATAAVLAGSMAQHTILWHNSLGVVALALVAWSAALAPVWRRDSWTLHAATAFGLLLGGINKLNFHLLALAFAAAWALYAAWTGRASGRELRRTALAVTLCGIVLPIAAELGWTGATPALWWHDVVRLASASRAAYLGGLLTAKFYLEPLHNYYGPLLLPAAGLTGGLTAALAAWGITRRTTVANGRRETFARCAGAVGAALAGALLLATNHEIAYVALTAGLVLAIALWLGFDGPTRGAVAWIGLGLPVVFIGGVSWVSAWQGQRSQFGTQSADRGTYVAVHATPVMDAYLRGTRIPPATADSLGALVARVPAPDARGRFRVFYGPGCEWLEHVWPAVKLPRHPLWMHPGTTYGPAEGAALAQAFAPGGPFNQVWVPVPWNYWPPEWSSALRWHFEENEIGGAFIEYRRLERLGAQKDAIAFVNTYGGNANGRLITTFDFPLSPEKLPDGRAFLGVRVGRGELDSGARAYRLRVRPVLQRIGGDPSAKWRAEFAATTPDEHPHEYWRTVLELAPGQAFVEAEHDFDSGGRPIRLRVIVPPDCSGLVAAGWRGPALQHSVPDQTDPPVLRPHTLPDSGASDAMRAALIHCDWKPDGLVVRGASTSAGGLVLAPGGEAWVRSDTPIAELRGTVVAESGHPTVRFVFRSGDRIEILQQFGFGGEDSRRDFRGWFPEAHGWYGVLVDPGTAPIVVKLTSVQRGN